MLRFSSIVFLCFLAHSISLFSQVKKMNYYDAVGVGTTSVLLLAEPIVMALKSAIEQSTIPAPIEIVYSIGYKSKRKKGETYTFPCMPTAFMWRTGLDTKIFNSASRASRNNGISRYSFWGGYLGTEFEIPTLLSRILFIGGIDFNYYYIQVKHSNHAETLSYRDNKHYFGLSPFIGLKILINDNLFVASEVNAFVGFRFLKRETNLKDKISTSKEDSPVFGLGIPRMVSLSVFYLINSSSK